MNIDDPTPGDDTRRDGMSHPAAQEVPVGLHGRLLNVSRIATIGEMAAGLAHELNQPLSAIATYAQACERLLARPGADPSELREALRQITAQTTRAADIIRRLRTLARGHQGDLVPVSVNGLVTELRDLIQTDAHIHGVRLSLDLAAQLPKVSVDPGQIQQVILNLVRNSLDAFAAGPGTAPEITIRTSMTSDGEIELGVIDNGPGLPPGARQRLFEHFFSTKENGTGLGLAISHTIARNHGGSVGHRANEPTGACFYILLPTQGID
jgi:two-component system sensor kinase FixL